MGGSHTWLIRRIRSLDLGSAQGAPSRAEIQAHHAGTARFGAKEGSAFAACVGKYLVESGSAAHLGLAGRVRSVPGLRAATPDGPIYLHGKDAIVCFTGASAE